MMSSERCLIHQYSVLETGNTFLITHIIKNFYIGKKIPARKQYVVSAQLCKVTQWFLVVRKIISLITFEF